MDCDLRIQSNCNSLVDIFLRFTTLDRYLKKVYGLIEEQNHYVPDPDLCVSLHLYFAIRSNWMNIHCIFMMAIKYLFMYLKLIIQKSNNQQGFEIDR